MAGGSVKPHTLSVSFAHSRSHFERAFKPLLCGAIDPQKIDALSLDETTLNALLLDRHELDHYHHLLSSPMGVLIWRLYQVQMRDVHYLCRLARQANIERDWLGLPLLDWYRKTGREKFMRASAEGLLDHPRLVEYIDMEVIPGIRDVSRLIDILYEDSDEVDETIGGFVDLLNNAFSYLSRRSDIPWSGSWDTRLPLNMRLFDGNNRLSVSRVLEMLAYLVEARYMVMLRNSTPNMVSWWERNRLPPRYQGIYQQWLERNAGDLLWANYELGLMLLGHFDISTCSHKPHVFLIEDEWPWLRPIWGRYRPDLWFNGKRALKNMCLHSKMHGEGSMWTTSEHDLVGRHVEQMSKAFRRAASSRLAVQSAGKSSMRNHISRCDSQLVFIEYSDIVVETKRPGSIQAMVGAMLHSALMSCAHSAVRGRPTESPRYAGLKLSRRLAEITWDRPIDLAISSLENLFSTRGMSELCGYPALFYD